jgi:hypothetical protein
MHQATEEGKAIQTGNRAMDYYCGISAFLQQNRGSRVAQRRVAFVAKKEAGVGSNESSKSEYPSSMGCGQVSQAEPRRHCGCPATAGLRNSCNTAGPTQFPVS